MLKERTTEEEVIRNKLAALESNWNNSSANQGVSNFKRKSQVNEYDRLQLKLDAITKMNTTKH